MCSLTTVLQPRGKVPSKYPAAVAVHLKAAIAHTYPNAHIEVCLTDVGTSEAGVPFKVPTTVKLPQYAHWDHYETWLPLNTQRLLLDL